MKPYRMWFFSLVGLISITAKADVNLNDLSAEAYTDIGSVVVGSFGGTQIDNQYLNRLGANITASDTLNGKLKLTVGVGGIFYQALPSAGYFWQRPVKFGPGINEASAEYIFTPNLSLQQGYFPLKYNHPAMDLGEYLLKSESYPTYLSTGGWTWVDSAFTRAFGLRLKASNFDGKFQQEAGIYLEVNNAPFYDITPAYLFDWRPSNGIEIGGGVALRRWFSPGLGYTNSSSQDQAATAAQYVTIANFPAVQNQAEVYYSYVDASGKQVNTQSFAVWNPGASLDTAAILAGKSNVSVTRVQMIQDGTPAGTRVGIKIFLQNLAGCSEDSTQCTTYLSANGNLTAVDATGAATGASALAQVTNTVDITRKAINVMAHVSFDFTQMFDWDKRNGSLVLYGEGAILGVQNQPVYYQDIFQRMPVMVGMHLPTFGLLDLLDLETEYLDNPYADEDQQFAGPSYESTLALTGSDQAIPDDVDYTLRKFTLPSVHGDDWKWCVYAVRSLLPGVKLKIQVANDHLRLQYFDGTTPSGPAFGAISAVPQTTSLSDWYYVAHLQWGF